MSYLFSPIFDHWQPIPFFLFLPNWSLQPTIKALQHGTFLFVLDKHSPSSSPPFPSWALSADLYEPHMRFLNEKYRIKKRQ